MIGLSGKPPGGGLSPVWPGPGTNGEVLGTTAGDEAADELLDVVSGADELLGGADDVVSGADDVVSGADELLGGAEDVVSGADELLGGADGLVGGADDVLGVPHGPWLRTNWPDHPL